MDCQDVAIRPTVVCREMTEGDFEVVTGLLTKGFAAWREAPFWRRALRRLADRAVPAAMPQLGYVLEVSGAVVGVLLLIASEWTEAGELVRRCNVSSFYIEPEFRLYGTLLVRQALRRRDVTYINVTPAPETWDLLAAQGYKRYASGRTIMLPLLARSAVRARARFAGPSIPPGPDLEAAEIELMREHANWDCLNLICETESGRVPFVFGLRHRRGVLPFAYLLYCRSQESLAAHARALGFALARRGIFLIVADADSEIAGVPGRFQPGHPKFFRGDKAPQAGDLAYTERAVFGA